jgi:hypothetical protein
MLTQLQVVLVAVGSDDRLRRDQTTKGQRSVEPLAVGAAENYADIEVTPALGGARAGAAAYSRHRSDIDIRADRHQRVPTGIDR